MVSRKGNAGSNFYREYDRQIERAHKEWSEAIQYNNLAIRASSAKSLSRTIFDTALMMRKAVEKSIEEAVEANSTDRSFHIEADERTKLSDAACAYYAEEIEKSQEECQNER